MRRRADGYLDFQQDQIDVTIGQPLQVAMRDGLRIAGVATDAIDADALATDAVNEIADGVLDRSVAEPSAAFSWPVSLRKFIQFVQALHNNKVTQTSTTTSLRNAADSGNIATFATSDDGTTFTRGKAT